MISSEIARIYSKALYHLSAGKNQLEQVWKDFSSIHTILEKQNFFVFFSAPQINLKQKEEILQTVFGERIDSDLLSFLKLLLKKDLFKYLPEIFKQFQQLANENFGIMEANLVTASALDDQLIEQELTEKLEKIYKKKIQMSYAVDPKLIGGGILTIDDKMIDFSLENRLNSLKNYLLK